MMKKQTRTPSRDGLLKDGTSRLARTSPRRGMPKIMWLAILVIVVGAVLLFRNQGGEVPTGIGERRSVVTVGADTALVQAAAPRSGDVDIADETPVLTPEKPAGGAAQPAAEPAAEPAARPAPAAEPQARPASRPATTAPARPAAEDPALLPQADGGWLVQVGSFGQAENADRAAAKLREKGWDARVKMGNTSDGNLIHRVQIGYFASRQTAEQFITRHKSDLAGAIAVHR